MNKNYYAIIPASVRYNDNLAPNAKLLYGEITALANEKGYCWANNSYFAELYKVSKETVSRWISKLESEGHIKTQLVYRDGSRELRERRIYISNTPIDKKINRYRQNNQDPIDEKINTPIDKKIKDNNTVLNNTFNITTTTKDNQTKNGKESNNPVADMDADSIQQDNPYQQIEDYYESKVKRRCSGKDLTDIFETYQKYKDLDFIFKTIDMVVERNIRAQGGLTIKSFSYFKQIFEEEWEREQIKKKMAEGKIENIKKDNTNENLYIAVIKYLNEKADKKFKYTNRSTQLKIKARLSEGYTLEDFKKVIDNKVASWKGTEWDRYLRPSTLFGDKFEGYLNENETVTIVKKQRDNKQGYSSYKSRFHNFEQRTDSYTEDDLEAIAERKRQEYIEKIKKSNVL